MSRAELADAPPNPGPASPGDWLGLGAFALALFLAAALLFVIQPMAAWHALPTLGGTPAVWAVCLAFFQAVLLGGYLYADQLARRGTWRGQAIGHVALLVATASFLLLADSPWGSSRPAASTSQPAASLVAWLAGTLGAPLVLVCATAPLLQRWFAATRHPAGRDPYFLYAASNVGSLAGLMAYPLVLEPLWPARELWRGWSLGFAALAALVAACGLRLPATAARPRAGDPGAIPDTATRIPAATWWRWVGLAALPASLLLGVTTAITTDVASTPLLWVVPLGLYLLSFVGAFGAGWRATGPVADRLLGLALVLAAVVLAVGLVHVVVVPVHLIALVLGATLCHGRLAAERPGPAGLTRFYLALAVGGALGGAFNAWLAPVLFDRVVEYPLALVGVAWARRPPGARPVSWSGRRSVVILPLVLGLLGLVLARGVVRWSDSALGALVVVAACGLFAYLAWTLRTEPQRFALGLGAGLAALGLADGVEGRVLERQRTFFGVLRVTHDERTGAYRLFHGSTLHGEQRRDDPALRREPLSYFRRGGPVGDLFAQLARRHPAGADVAVVGLGAGSLAAYARPSDRFTFLELDPAVVRIARDPRLFTFLADCQARELALVVGDARQRLAEQPARSLDLIVLDAFSSDAVPAHLATVEALAIDLERLRPGGWIAMNLSNRYLELTPVVAALARRLRIAGRVWTDTRLDRAARDRGEQPAIWVVLARQESDLGALAARPEWRSLPPASSGDAWTDQHASVLACLRWRPYGRTVTPRP